MLSPLFQQSDLVVLAASAPSSDELRGDKDPGGQV
jgi:hypothetical protein